MLSVLGLLAALLVLVTGLSLVAVIVFSVYLIIVHRRFSHLPSPKGAS